MWPISKEYDFLEQEEQSPGSEPHNHPSFHHGVSSSNIKSNIKATRALVMFLIVSITLNSILATYIFIRSPFYSRNDQSRDSPLTQAIQVPFVATTPYSDHKDPDLDNLWAQISIDRAVVALSDSYVTTTGLPTAQRFPWDYSKGIYLLNGYHLLHCIQIIFISLSEHRHSVPQSRAFPHVLHCLDEIRQDIICHADATPRYTTADAVPETGVGQVHQCASWGALEAFADANNACFRFVNQTDPIDTLERFRFCPEGSPYKERVERFFPPRQ